MKTIFFSFSRSSISDLPGLFCFFLGFRGMSKVLKLVRVRVRVRIWVMKFLPKSFYSSKNNFGDSIILTLARIWFSAFVCRYWSSILIVQIIDLLISRLNWIRKKIIYLIDKRYDIIQKHSFGSMNFMNQVKVWIWSSMSKWSIILKKLKLEALKPYILLESLRYVSYKAYQFF